MKVFVKKYWRLCCLSYTIIYLAWFFLLEAAIPADYPGLHIIHSTLDDAIPFCEYFVIPYVIWFVYIVFCCGLLYFKGTDLEFLRLAIALAGGMSFCLVICMIYPNGLNLRPETMPRENIFTAFIERLYSTDTPTNVFPSIHVYVSLILHIIIRNCEYVRRHMGIRYISFVTSILICISTLFIKQHSIIDVLGGMGVTLLFCLILYIPKYRRWSSSISREEQEQP